MHSDEIKAEIAKLNKKLDELENSPTKDIHSLELIRARATLLNADALNELNWSFYYTKEELKILNKNLQLLR